MRELWGYLTNLSAANAATLAVGLVAMAMLVVMRRVLPMWPSALIVVVLGIAAAWGWDLAAQGVALVGEVPAGLPAFEIPAVSLDDVQSLIVPAIGIFLVSFSDAILISRAIAAKNKETVDADQELLAFGTANISAGLTAGMPIGASGSRTAVNDSMRVTSQVGGLVNAITVAIILLFLTGADPVPAHRRPRRDHHRRVSRDHRGGRLGDASPEQPLRGGDRAGDYGPRPDRGRAAGAVRGGLAVHGRRGAAAWRTRTTRFRATCRASTASATSSPSRTPRCSRGIVIYRLDDRIFFANCQRVNSRIWSAISGAPKPVHWLVFDVAGVPDTDSAAQAALLELKSGLTTAGIGLVFATMRETLRLDLEEGQVLEELVSEDDMFETVEAAVVACLDRMDAGRPGTCGRTGDQPARGQRRQLPRCGGRTQPARQGRIAYPA